jgi:hypothetical protein
MNCIRYGNWIPGGVLRVYSQRYGVWHYGILTWLYGMPMVMHASKERGHFVLTTYDEFACGQPVRYTWLPENLGIQQAVLTRAESLLGKSFNLLTANCEDDVNWIVTGAARSPQREQATTMAILIAVFLGGLGGFGGTVAR